MITFGSLFSGIGGLDLGLERAGMRCIWQCEVNPFARKVLQKHWPGIPCYEDVRSINGSDGSVKRPDLICGGFPCQDISYAGVGAGLDGARSGLWFEYARLIREIRPRFVLVENVAALLVRGLDRVLGSLASLGYDAEWSMLSACCLGAPHTRERMFVIAYRDEVGRRSLGLRNERQHGLHSGLNAWETSPRGKWGDVERWAREAMETGNGIVPATERRGMVDGIPDRLERTGGCGNAVVPQVGELLGRRIMDMIKDNHE